MVKTNSKNPRGSFVIGDRSDTKAVAQDSRSADY